jgi:hypothetical protein
MRSMLRKIPIVGEWLRHDIEAPADWIGEESGRRILVEEEDPALRGAMAAALRDAGYMTAECAGPGSHGDGRCPLVERGQCAAVDEADAVMQVLVPSDEAMNEVRSIIREHRPDLPIALMAPEATAFRYPHLVDGATVSSVPLTRKGVAGAADEVLG